MAVSSPCSEFGRYCPFQGGAVLWLRNTKRDFRYIDGRRLEPIKQGNGEHVDGSDSPTCRSRRRANFVCVPVLLRNLCHLFCFPRCAVDGGCQRIGRSPTGARVGGGTTASVGKCRGGTGLGDRCSANMVVAPPLASGETVEQHVHRRMSSAGRGGSCDGGRRYDFEHGHRDLE